MQDAADSPHLIDVVVKPDLQGVGLRRDVIEDAARQVERFGRFDDRGYVAAVISAIRTAVKAVLVEVEQVVFQLAGQFFASLDGGRIGPAIRDVFAVVQMPLAVEVAVDESAFAIEVAATLFDHVSRIVLSPDQRAGSHQRERGQAEEGQPPRRSPHGVNG